MLLSPVVKMVDSPVQESLQYRIVGSIQEILYRLAQSSGQKISVSFTTVYKITLSNQSIAFNSVIVQAVGY